MSDSNFLELCKDLGSRRVASLFDKDVSNAPGPVEYPFKWGDCWTANVIVNVPDLESEVGFWIDLMGFPPFVIFDESVMFRSPDNSFGMTLSRSTDDNPTSTNVSVELMLGNIEEVVETLRERGIEFQSILHPVWGEEHSMRTCNLVSPNGIRITLWGMIAKEESAETESEIVHDHAVEQE